MLVSGRGGTWSLIASNCCWLSMISSIPLFVVFSKRACWRFSPPFRRTFIRLSGVCYSRRRSKYLHGSPPSWLEGPGHEGGSFLRHSGILRTWRMFRVFFGSILFLKRSPFFVCLTFSERVLYWSRPHGGYLLSVVFKIKEPCGRFDHRLVNLTRAQARQGPYYGATVEPSQGNV